MASSKTVNFENRVDPDCHRIKNLATFGLHTASKYQTDSDGVRKFYKSIFNTYW